MACPSNPVQNTNEPNLRLLEVNIDLRTNDAKTVMLEPSQISGAQTRTATTAVQSTSSIETNRMGVGFHDDEVNNLRYVYATFQVENNTGIGLNNLTAWALDMPTISGAIPTPTLFGTMFRVVNSGAGAAINDGAIIRGIQPTHGVRPTTAGGVIISPETADMQIFPTSERTEVGGQLNGTYGITTGNILGYGYVARNATTGARLIGASNGVANTANSCTADSCRGYITFAFKIPVLPTLVSPRQNRPAVFSFLFALGNQTTASGTQSVEEQAATTITGKTSATGTPRLLGGSSRNFFSSSVNNLCQVPTANASGAFASQVLMPASVSVIEGSLDTCF